MNNKSNIIYSGAYLDWAFDEDNLQNYKLVTNGMDNVLSEGDIIVLKVHGRPEKSYAKVLRVGDNHIIVHTEKWFDIFEEYDILTNTNDTTR